jgi:hypothetical protein
LVNGKLVVAFEGLVETDETLHLSYFSLTPPFLHLLSSQRYKIDVIHATNNEIKCLIFSFTYKQ